MIMLIVLPIITALGGWLARSKKIHSKCMGIELDIENTENITRELNEIVNEIQQTKKINPNRWGELKSKLDIIVKNGGQDKETQQ